MYQVCIVIKYGFVMEWLKNTPTSRFCRNSSVLHSFALVFKKYTVDIRYLEYPLSRTFSSVPLALSVTAPINLFTMPNYFLSPLSSF